MTKFIKFTDAQTKVLNLCRSATKHSTVYIMGPRRYGKTTMAKQLAVDRPEWRIRDLGFKQPNWEPTEEILNENGRDGVFVFLTPRSEDDNRLPKSKRLERHEILVGKIDSESIMNAFFVVLIDKRQTRAK
jgi:hypothetical protein